MPSDVTITAPISVFGAPRSGTTLVSEILRLHSDTNVSHIGETGNLIFGLWHGLEFAKGVTLPTRRGERVLSADERSAEVIRDTLIKMFPDQNRRWFHKPIGLPKAVSEKFEDNDWDDAAVWYWNAFRSTFPDGRAIFLLRHPCDVVISQKAFMGFEESSLWWSYAFVMHLMAHRSAPRGVVVRFERLLENREEGVRKMFAAADLRFEPHVLEAFEVAHVPDTKRKMAPDATSRTRRAQWDQLDPSQLKPAHRLAIEQAFATFGESFEWPEHFMVETEANEAPETAQEQIARLEALVDQLGRRNEMNNMDNAAERRHIREELNRWRSLVSRNRHHLPLSMDLAAELDRQLDLVGPDREDVGEVRELDPAYVAGIERELAIIKTSRTWGTAERFFGVRARARGVVRHNLLRVPEPARNVWQSARRLGSPKDVAQPATPPAVEETPSISLVLPSGVTLGGVTSWAIEMSRVLSETQTVNLLRHPDEGPTLDLELPSTVTVIESSSRALPPLRSVAGYANDYREALPTILLPNYNHAGYAFAAELSKSTPDRIRTLGFAHTDTLHYYSLLTYYEPIIHKFVAVSDEISDKLRALLPERAGDVEVVPYGVLVDATIDRQPRPASQPLRLVYAGRIEQEQKRVMRLLSLAKALVRAGVDFELDIIGDGPEKKALEKRYEELEPEVKARVTILPSVAPSEMKDVWASYDVCVLVSAFEGTSIAMLEAMAQGCVPVVTNVSGTAAVIDDGKNGFTCSKNQIRDMVDVLAKLAEDRTRLAKIGVNAHATIVRSYSFDAHKVQISQICAEQWKREGRSWNPEVPTVPASREAHDDYIARRLRAL